LIEDSTVFSIEIKVKIGCGGRMKKGRNEKKKANLSESFVSELSVAKREAAFKDYIT
jgi:hypothetical protein